LNKEKIPEPKDILRSNNAETKLTKALTRKKRNLEHTTSVSYSDLFNIAKDLEYKSDISNDIYDLFPDIKLTIELMVSSIISPNDNLSTNINYSLDSIKLPVDLSIIISNTIKQYVNKHYDLNDDMFEIIKKSMYIDGSYIKVIFPLNSVADLISKYKIKTGYESDIVNKVINKNIINSGEILGNMITVTDDFNIVNIKDITTEKQSENNFNKLLPGFEDNSSEITDELLMLNTTLDNNNSKPLIKNIPHNKIIPIPDKNDPSIHYGYLMLLDSNGNNIDFSNDYNNTMETSMEKSILTRAKDLISNRNNNIPELNNIEDLKEDLITAHLKKKLKLNDIDDSINQDVYVEVADLLLSRFIKNKKSKVLFIPKELVTYYAYEYNSNGTGKPLLEKVSVLASMRAITLFVTLLAYVKSSISTTNVTVDIDEDDDDYESTMEKVMTEVMKNRQLNLPIGILKVDDMTDWLHKIGFSFNFNHPGLPDTKVSISEDKNDIDPVNSDLLEKIDKQMIRALGATPEMVENSGSVDFATTIVNNNILFARRTLSYQKVYDIENTKHIQKILKLDGNLRNTIFDIINDNLSNIKKYVIKNEHNNDTATKIKNVSDEAFKQYIYSNIVNGIKLSLPKPNIEDNTKLEDQYSKFKDKVDDIIDVIFDENALPEELIGDFSDKLDSLKALIKTVIIKRWLIDNDYMSEVTEMFTLNSDGIPMVDMLTEYSSYIESIEKTVLPFIKKTAIYKEKFNDKLSKAGNTDDDNNEQGENDAGDTTSDDTSSNDMDDTSDSDSSDTDSDVTSDDTEDDNNSDDNDSATTDDSTEEDDPTDA